MRRRPIHAAAAARAGFSLIEVVVAVTIVAILIGTAVPVTAKILTAKARRETRDELVVLGAASLEYFRDVAELPAAVADLLRGPPGVAGWSGPYLSGTMEDMLSGRSTFEVDAWSRPYRLTPSSAALAIASAGPDADFDTDDDLALEVGTTIVRREQTLERVKIVNQAIVNYNSLYQATDPLPANFSVLFSKLVAKGFLPPDAELTVDAWNVPLIENPIGMAPVVRIKSKSIAHNPDLDVK